MEDVIEILFGERCAAKEQGVHSLDPTISVVEKQSRQISNTLDMVEKVPTVGAQVSLRHLLRDVHLYMSVT